MTIKRTVIRAFILLATLHAAAQAQSTLSNQGFGYPTGGLSARTQSAGGATAELDALSALNPAAIISWGSAGLAAQFSPEVLRLKGPGGASSTTSIRFPIYAAGLSVGGRIAVGATSSTLLDQTWSTRFDDSQIVNGQTVASTTLVNSQGGMNDVRLAVAGSVTKALRLGVAYHLVSGSNLLSTQTDYSPSDILDATIRTTFGYSGSAWSVGAVILPTSNLSLGLSAKLGGDLRLSRGDTRLSNASVPDRFGASLSYTGLRGALLAARFEKASWSQIDALGGDGTDARDTQEIGVGAELPGPQIVGTPSLLRLGARWRDLPFAAGGANVREGTYGMGLGLSVAGGRALVDFGIGRAFRSNNSAYRESAWTLITGILVRP